MVKLIIIGELEVTSKAYYKIKFSGAYKGGQVKFVHLDYNHQYYELIGCIVQVNVFNSFVQNKVLNCKDYEIKLIV